MATSDVFTSDIMDAAAALMNDSAMEVYNYETQIPYLKIVVRELREILELSSSPVTSKKSTVINLDAGIVSVGFDTTPALPPDLVDIYKVWESPEGMDRYIPMSRKDSIPDYYLGVESSYFGIWAWQDNAIKLPSANADIDLKLDYLRSISDADIDENSNIGVINCDSFVTFRLAALLAEFVEENTEHKDSLMISAIEGKDRMLGIENKGKQAIMTRRRPFRASYKRIGNIT